MLGTAGGLPLHSDGGGRRTTSVRAVRCRQTPPLYHKRAACACASGLRVCHAQHGHGHAPHRRQGRSDALDRRVASGSVPCLGHSHPQQPQQCQVRSCRRDSIVKRWHLCSGASLGASGLRSACERNGRDGCGGVACTDGMRTPTCHNAVATTTPPNAITTTTVAGPQPELGGVYAPRVAAMLTGALAACAGVTWMRASLVAPLPQSMQVPPTARHTRHRT